MNTWFLVAILVILLISAVIYWQEEVHRLKREINARNEVCKSLEQALDESKSSHVATIKRTNKESFEALEEYSQLYDKHTSLERQALDIAGHGQRLIELMQSSDNTVIEEHEVMSRFNESVEKLEELIKP